MRAILDTSVLISDDPHLLPDEASISVVAPERARRLRRLGFVEAEFDPVPVDAEIARTWAGLASLCVERGLQPRRRAMDLLIAATAMRLGLPLITLDQDLVPLADVVDIRKRPD